MADRVAKQDGGRRVAAILEHLYGLGQLDATSILVVALGEVVSQAAEPR
jgi:hypothetical protein